MCEHRRKIGMPHISLLSHSHIHSMFPTTKSVTHSLVGH